MVVATQRQRAFDAAIPRTHRERTRGLRGRDRLAPDEALLIERCRSVHTFGMRVPITVVFLDRSWRVDPGGAGAERDGSCSAAELAGSSSATSAPTFG